MEDEVATEAGAIPFVGRDDVIGALARTLADPTGPGTLLRGAAGSGRTEVLQRARARAAAHGVAALEVQGRPADGARPFASLGRTLPGLLDDPARPTSSLLRRARELALDAGSAVVVDDAHLLDGASAEVLHHLVVADRWPAVLAAPAGVALPEPIVALRVQGAIEVVALDPLADPEVGTLVEALVGGPIDEATRRRFTLLTEGLPLHVVELVRAAGRLGALRSEGGLVRWRAPATATWELGGLLRARIDAMAERERRALSAVALAGDLRAETLDRLEGPGAAGAIAASDLLRTEGATLAIAHPVVAELLVAALDPDERRARRLAIATVLEAEGTTDARLRSLALRTEAGSTPPTPLLLDAAAEVLRRGDPTLAASLYRRAVDHDPGRALLGLARAAAAGGDLGAALEATAAATAEPLDDGDRLGAALLALELERWLGPPAAERARALLDLARTLDVDRAARHDAIAEAGAELVGAGRPSEGLALLAPLLGEDPSHPSAALAAAEATAVLGAPVDARALLDASGPTDDDVRAIRVLELVGDRRALERRSAELRGRAAADLRGERSQASADIAAGLAAMLAGAHRGAVRHLQRAVALLEGRPDGRALAVLARWRLIESLAWAGQRHQAEVELGQIAGAALAPCERLDRERALLAIWSTAGEELDPERASAILDHLGEARAAGLVAPALELAALAWRAGIEEAGALARSMAEEVQGPRSRALGQLLDAVAGDDAELALDAAGQLGALGREVEATEAAELAAATFDRAGTLRRAIAAAMEARRWSQGIERTVRRTTPVALPELSARELEIAQLVGAGMSNREIAAQLYLSVRTVEGHILRASAKVGVEDRGGLARAAELVGRASTGSSGPDL